MRIGKVKTVRVTDSRPDFDRACLEASVLANTVFGITIDGHSDIVDFIRSTDCVCIKFLSYTHTASMVGREHIYKFEAWIERYEDE